MRKIELDFNYIKHAFLEELQTKKEIAKHFGCSPVTIDKFTRKHGLYKSPQQIYSTISKSIKKTYGVENCSQIDFVKDKKKNYRTGFASSENLIKKHSEKLLSEQKFIEYIKSFEIKPTYSQIAKELNMTRTALCTKIYRLNLKKYFKLEEVASQPSYIENELFNIFKSEGLIRNDRKTLNGLELDLYFPKQKIAIEINGTFWHASNHEWGKPINYHQQKSQLCQKQGVRLIHVFEYEWQKDKQKIIDFIKNAITSHKRIYARQCCVKVVENTDVRDFLETNHLQGFCHAKINVVLMHTGKIVGLMSFGKSRFNNKFEWENIRTCFKLNTTVVGGVEKLFNHFINNFKLKNIISYCDFSKFSGQSYTKLGFTFQYLSKPNYVWVKGSEVLTRYQSQTINENKIMTSLGFYKVYNSGNLVYKYESNFGKKL